MTRIASIASLVPIPLVRAADIRLIILHAFAGCHYLDVIWKDVRSELKAKGFVICPGFIPNEDLQELRADMELACSSASGAIHGIRNLLRRETTRRIANGDALIQTVTSILGSPASCVRGIYFDKPATANWAVPWHQDLTIAVAERVETPGFGPWSVKEGVVHVQPPAEVLERMVTVRIHLDDCDSENGPLWVALGTHRLGRIPESEISGLIDRSNHAECVVSAGGAVLMMPLILHCSATSRSRKPRRVVHLEYAAEALPGSLRWESSLSTC